MNLNEVIDSVKKALSFYKEIEIMGVKYGLGILTIEEETKANTDASNGNFEGIAFINNLRRNILSYAIKNIADTVFGDIIEVEEGGTIVKQERAIFMKNFINKVPTDLTDHLFEAYIDLKEETEEKMKSEIKYNWYKTPEVRKKEIEDRMKKNKEEEEEIKFKEVKVPTEDKEEK